VLTAFCSHIRRAQLDLSADTRNHALSRLQEARQGVDNGAGENDLKRLQRKFQATKASYINVDVKERFMQSEWACAVAPSRPIERQAHTQKAAVLCAHALVLLLAALPDAALCCNSPIAGLRDGTLDVATLEENHKGLEEQLQRDSEALRGLKDQNAHAKQALVDTSAQIATLHQQFEQVMGDVTAQLDVLERNLQQFEASRPAPLEPLGDGPTQAECDAQLQEEMARAKQLEAAIASSEVRRGGGEFASSRHKQ
jgi:hypothetical protein